MTLNTTPLRMRSPEAEGPAAGRPGGGLSFVDFPWARLLLAAVPLAVVAYYLTDVAPGQLPLPDGVKAPFPALTEALEEFCPWCGENAGMVWGAAAALLGAGFLLQVVRVNVGMYYLGLALAATLAFALGWYSISAPVDRLLKSVEDRLPRGAPKDPALRG